MAPRKWWVEGDRADRFVAEGGQVSRAYCCSREDCGRFDSERGGCVPPIVGDWFCRLHLAEALRERTGGVR